MFKVLTKIFKFLKTPAGYSHLRDHKIIFGDFSDEGHPVDTIFEETRKPVTIEDHKHLPCVYCGREPTPEGHDACISNLNSVEFACCGHHTKEGYIRFINGIFVRGYFNTDKKPDEKTKINLDGVLSELKGVSDYDLGDKDHKGYINFTNGKVITGYFMVEK